MIDELSRVCITLERQSIKNTLKLNSVCFVMVKPNNIDELKKVIEIINRYNYKYIVLGNASNVILPEFYGGVVIKLDNFNKYEINDDVLYCEAGVIISNLSSKLIDMGYAGLDFAIGIPGTIGGSVYSNAGCFGSSIDKVLISAQVFDGNRVIELSNKDLEFGYRDSILKRRKNYIVLSCKFQLTKDDVYKLKSEAKERRVKRMTTQDLSHPSNGSIFRNPEGFAAGKLIDDAGLKGYSINDAMVSLIHANFIINSGNATQDDIVKLIKVIQDKIKKEDNIDLVLEQEIIE